MAPGQSKVSDQYNCERKFIQRGDDLTKPSSGRSEARNIAETIDLETLRSLAFQLPDDSKYEELLRQIGDAQVVMIGESTHGSHEFLEERVRITKRLIEKKVTIISYKVLEDRSC